MINWRDRRFLKGATIGALIALAAFSFAVFVNYQGANTDEKEFVSVIDGDTLKLATGETVRLICIDTPEKGESGYAEAANYLSSLIVNAKSVEFVPDRDDADSYGRLLRYAYADGVFLNREMVRSGHAQVFPYGNDTAKCDEIGS